MQRPCVRSRVLWCAFCLIWLSGLQRSAAEQPQRFHLVHAAMGTEFSLDLYAPNQAVAQGEADLAFEEVDRLEELLSNYRPASELSRISREAAHGTCITDPETFRFLTRAFYWSRVSGGAFDITVGPLLRAWGFFFHGGHVPPAPQLAALRPAIGWTHVRLDPARRAVSFDRGQAMELDPGSIGKGFAVEAVVGVLREAGVTAALISAGNSTVYGLGAPPGAEGWPVRIPDPRQPDKIFSTVYLKDTSLSTGACTMKFFIRNGHRYCHIFDPRSMRPVEGVLQTTVIDPSPTDSDALSTVAFVLSPEASRPIIDASSGRRALIFRQTTSANGGCFALNWEGTPCGSQTASRLRR